MTAVLLFEYRASAARYIAGLAGHTYEVGICDTTGGVRWCCWLDGLPLGGQHPSRNAAFRIAQQHARENLA